jgi:hypothetical protein
MKFEVTFPAAVPAGQATRRRMGPHVAAAA